MATFLQVAFDGLLNGLLYALVAAGLSLIWGVMDVINFAHGEFLMIAMYLSYWLGFIWKIDPLISSIAGRGLCFHSWSPYLQVGHKQDNRQIGNVGPACDLRSFHAAEKYMP